MWHDWPAPRLDKRKIDQTSVLCRRVEFACRRSQRSYSSPTVRSLNSSTLVQVSHALGFQVITLPILTHRSLASLFPFADKSPLERAKFLETTELFASIHAAAAAGGQTAVPDNLDTDLHFTCFIQAPEASAREAKTTTGEHRLIELDGRRAGPVDRGKSTDLLKVRTAWSGLVRFRVG